MKIHLRRPMRTDVRATLTLHRKRKPTLEPDLYMRPIRAMRIGTSNTEWSSNGWHRQGVPLGKSLLLVLKCGHIVSAPQRPVKLRRLVYCPMCFMLWTERAEADTQSKSRERKRIHNQHTEEMTDMAKKKSSKKSSDDRRGRKVFEYVKAPKADLEGKNVMRTVHDAIKKMKSGTVSEITEAAIKAGLKDHTDQDPVTQTGVMLNRLASMNSVRKVKPEKTTKKISIKLKK